MKCPRCLQLNMPNDTECFACKAPLNARSTAACSVTGTWSNPSNPQWSYLFSAGCGAIPIVALGGLIPIILGLGGASMCFTVARASSFPVALRVLACLLITVCAWLLFVMMAMAMFAAQAETQ